MCVFARCSLRVLCVAVFGDFFERGRIFAKINVSMQILHARVEINRITINKAMKM